MSVPPFYEYEQAAYAPECRSCLRIVGSGLASMPPDERMPRVVALVIDEVQRTGASRVVGVPGDQTEELRAAIRAELRRLKLRGSTHLVGDAVSVVSNDAWDALTTQRKEELQGRVLVALSGLAAGESPPPPTTGIDWGAWEVT